MTKIASALATITMIGLMIVGGSAWAAAKQDFTLVNKTGYVISKVYVSPSDSDDWEEDVLGRDILNDGEDVDISFHRDTTGCKWDLKVTYKIDNSSVVWKGFNICDITKISIFYDANGDKTSATTE